MISKRSFFILAILLASTALALATQDPQLEQCKHQCRAQRETSQKKISTCLQDCEEYAREKREREQGRGQGGGTYSWNEQSPSERLRECTQGCRQERSEQKQQKCLSYCRKEYEREKEQYEGGGRVEIGRGREQEEEEQEEWQGQKGQSPYVFEDRHFMTGMQTQHGRVRILQKFTDRSKLLRGIENYRVTILEAAPQTFVVPNHWDADAVVFVANGDRFVNYFVINFCVVK